MCGFTNASTSVVIARSYSRYSGSTSHESDTAHPGYSSRNSSRTRRSWRSFAYEWMRHTPTARTPRCLKKRAASLMLRSSSGRSSAPRKSSRPPTSRTSSTGTIRSGFTQKYELP